MTHAYQTQEFHFTEVELKGEKKYFIEGYISSIKPDDFNEVVTLKAQESLARQVQNKIITMDVEHEEFLDGNGQVLPRPKSNHVPVAKIVESELRSKGVWVKAEINKNSSRFGEIWGSIKDQFLHSFSIAFATVKAITKEVQGRAMRFIEDLNLINVTLTGCPVNKNATFTPVMKAVLKTMEGSNMSEEESKKQEENKEPEKDAGKKEEDSKAAEADKAEEDKEKSSLEEVKKDIEEQKAALEKEKKALEDAKKVFEDDKKKQEEALKDPEGPMAQIKSLKAQAEENKKTMAELKAKLEAPILKSRVEKEKKEGLYKQDPLDTI